MATLSSLMVELGLDSSGFTGGLGDAKNDIRGFAGDVSDSLASIGSTMVTAALASATARIVAISASLRVCVAEAMEAEENQYKLNAVLKSTKNAAGMTASACIKLADSLSLVTTFADDEILSAENLMLTFTSISKDTFPDAMEAALNMSAALGQDMKSSVIQLGKALNSPIEGASALRRVGVALTDQQEEQIKTFQEAGDILSAQKIILQELETEFGGLAEAMGETTSGKIKILANRFMNLAEAIGTSFLPAINYIVDYISPKLMPVFEELSAKMVTFFGSDFFIKIVEQIARIGEALINFMTGANGVDLLGVADQFAYLGIYLGISVETMTKFRNVFGDIITFVSDNKNNIASLVETFATLAIIATTIKALTAALSPLTIAIAVLVGLAEVLKRVWNEDMFGVKEKVGGMFTNTINSIDSIRYRTISNMSDDPQKQNDTNDMFFSLEESVKSLQNGDIFAFFTGLTTAVDILFNKIFDFKQIWEDLKLKVSEFGTTILGLWTNIETNFIAPWMARLQPMFEKFGATLGVGIPSAIESLKASYAKFIEPFINQIKGSFESLQIKLQVLFELISKMFQEHIFDNMDYFKEQLPLDIGLLAAYIRVVAVTLAKFIEVTLGVFITSLQGMTKRADDMLNLGGNIIGEGKTTQTDIDRVNSLADKIAGWEPSDKLYETMDWINTISNIGTPGGISGLMSKLIPEATKQAINNVTGKDVFNTNNGNNYSPTTNIYTNQDNVSGITNYLQQDRLLYAP